MSRSQMVTRVQRELCTSVGLLIGFPMKLKVKESRIILYREWMKQATTERVK